MMQHKIVPSLWFNSDGGSLTKIINYYKNIFGQDFQDGQIMPLGDTPGGNTEICEVHIFGQKYALINTAKEHQALNDAISFIINCEDQKEIDNYWEYFTREGEESQCGWCIDKYGLRWQVLPEHMGELMRQPDAAEVMMKQKKIVIEDYYK